MNHFIQNILVFTAVVLAVAFLVKKFFIKSDASNNPDSYRECGKDDCDCH